MNTDKDLRISSTICKNCGHQDNYHGNGKMGGPCTAGICPCLEFQSPEVSTICEDCGICYLNKDEHIKLFHPDQLIHIANTHEHEWDSCTCYDTCNHSRHCVATEECEVLEDDYNASLQLTNTNRKDLKDKIHMIVLSIIDGVDIAVTHLDIKKLHYQKTKELLELIN